MSAPRPTSGAVANALARAGFELSEATPRQLIFVKGSRRVHVPAGHAPMSALDHRRILLESGLSGPTLNKLLSDKRWTTD